MSKKVDVKDPASTRAYLESCFDKGLCPYVAGRQVAIEPSCLAAIALRNQPELKSAFVAALRASQNKDGGWSSGPAGSESDWVTAAALLALLLVGDATDKTAAGCLDSGLDYLMDNRSEHYGLLTRIGMLVFAGPDADYPRGWPWTQHSFDWVEPTAYSIMALSRCRQSQDVRVSAAVNQARRFLLKCALPGGGWNCAARDPKDKSNYANPCNTAQALLAFAGEPLEPAIRGGLDYLANVDDPAHQTVLALGWSILALDAHNRPVSQKQEQLRQMVAADGSLGSDLIANALGCMALSIESGNPFKKGP